MKRRSKALYPHRESMDKSRMGHRAHREVQSDNHHRSGNNHPRHAGISPSVTAVRAASAVCAALFRRYRFQRLSVVSFHVSLLGGLLADFAINLGIAWLPGREA